MAEFFTPVQVVTFTNDTTAVNAVNGNFTALSGLLNDVLSRGGVSPNQMNSSLDMNSNQILNLPPPATSNSPARLIDVIGEAGTLTVPPTGTSGAVVGFLNGNNTYSGTSLFTNTVSVNPAAGGTLQGFNSTLSATGSQSGGFVVPSVSHFYGLNTFVCTSDNVTRPTSGAQKFGVFGLAHSYGGTNLIGGRDTFDVESYLINTTSTFNPDRNYQAANFEWYSNVNDNGTVGAPAGAGFCVGGAAILASGATNWLNLTFVEMNVACTTGASVAYKTGMQISSLPQDAVQGSSLDAMIALSNQSGAVGWLNGIAFSNFSGQNPMATTGTLISTVGSATVANGINFNSYTFTGAAIQTPGFEVTGTGQTVVSQTPGPQLILNNPSTQLSQIAFQNAATTKAAVSWDNTNNFLELVALGSATLVFQTNSINALLIGPTGALTLGGTNSWTPNGTSAAVTLTAVTPAAVTSTVVHEWLTIVDSSGNTVYIPCWH